MKYLELNIGQQLFFLEEPYEYARIKLKLIHKYFEIIDVISLDKSSLNYSNYGYNYSYEYPNENDGKIVKVGIKPDNVACFVLKNIQTNETLHYSLFGGRSFGEKVDRCCILVGGYVKLKEEMVGQYFVDVMYRIENGKNKNK